MITKKPVEMHLAYQVNAHYQSNDTVKQSNDKVRQTHKSSHFFFFSFDLSYSILKQEWSLPEVVGEIFNEYACI